MSEGALDRATNFNDQLIALATMGVPIDLGFGQQPLPDKLRQVSAEFGIQTRRGQEIEIVLADSKLPAKYRAALQTWLRCDQPTVVFDAISRPTRAKRKVASDLGQALIYPLIVFLIAYVGFIYFCLYLFPKIEAIYTQISMQPPLPLSLLQSVRAAMPIWVPLVPLLVLAAVVLWRFRAARASWRWLPGGRRYFDLLQGADYADQIASLIDRGTTRDEAVAMLGPMNSQQQVSTARPLLTWALDGAFDGALDRDLGGQSMPSSLRFVAKFYRRLAQRRSLIWRVALPSIVGALLGGVFVLAYGLSLFVPVAQLLRDLASLGGR